MEKDFILTSDEFSKLLGISKESLRSRRRRGLYKGMYIRKGFAFLWKKPRPLHVHGPQVRDELGLSAHASSTKNIGRLPLAKRKRNKNSGSHKQELRKLDRGTGTKYPNAAFEIHNEIKMVAKAQRKINAAEANEIVPEVIALAKERHRKKILDKMKEPFLLTEKQRQEAETRRINGQWMYEREQRMNEEEKSGKWHNVLEPEKDEPPKKKKDFYYW